VIQNSDPNSSSNVTDNPGTGGLAMAIVWIIGIGILLYAFSYFRQMKDE